LHVIADLRDRDGRCIAVGFERIAGQKIADHVGPVAGAVEEHVVPLAAGELVRAALAAQHVVAAAAVDPVVAVAADDGLTHRSAADRIGEPRSDHRLEPAHHVDADPVRGRPREQVDIHRRQGFGVGQDVVAVVAVEPVRAHPAFDEIVTAAAGDDIVAPIAVEVLAVGAADDHILAGAALDRAAAVARGSFVAVVAGAEQHRAVDRPTVVDEVVAEAQHHCAVKRSAVVQDICAEEIGRVVVLN